MINRYYQYKSSCLLFYCCVLISSISYANQQNIAANPGIAPKIIGGVLAKSDAWPFMAALVWKEIPPVQGQFCAASLIDKQWALTAAHCVTGLQEDEFDLFIGSNQLSSDNGQLISISQIIVHNMYNPLFYDFDIALLKLKNPVTATPIQTLGRFSIQDRIAGAPATIIGWGTISANTRHFPDFLHEIELPIILNVNCNVPSGITKNMLCLGVSEGGKDSCAGDSGGPAFLTDPESNGLRQIGIVSFGKGCALPDSPGIYTRVSEFREFISSAICSAGDIPGAPAMNITIDGQRVTVAWNKTQNAAGYRLNFAPYPHAYNIYSLDMNQKTSFSITLKHGDAYYVAINAYKHNCRSDYSAIEHFIIP